MAWPSKIYNGPTGYTQIWKFWRHCCCRYGWYPLLVACVLTAACLLDLYSSFSCEFLKVDVGFNPANAAWNQSTANIGLFYYENRETEGVQFGDDLAPGCQRYTDMFESQFIDGDRTWQVSRVMAMISALSGMIATVASWLLVVTPLSASFVWPGVMLPIVLLAFIAEGSKFLFFDVAVCHASVWYPTGSESSPLVATSCEMGSTGSFVISACAIFFLGLVMICLKAPQKRTLKEHYGDSYADNYMVGVVPLHSGSLIEDPEMQIPSAQLGSIEEVDENSASLHAAQTSMVMSMSPDDASEGSPGPQDPPPYPGSESFVAEIAKEFTIYPLKRTVSEDNGLNSGVNDTFESDTHRKRKTRVPMDPPTDAQPIELAKRLADEPDDEMNYLATRVSANPPGATLIVDNDSDDLIDKCISDLAKSFQHDDVVVVEKKSASAMQ